MWWSIQFFVYIILSLSRWHHIEPTSNPEKQLFPTRYFKNSFFRDFETMQHVVRHYTTWCGLAKHTLSFANYAIYLRLPIFNYHYSNLFLFSMPLIFWIMQKDRSNLYKKLEKVGIKQRRYKNSDCMEWTLQVHGKNILLKEVKKRNNLNGRNQKPNQSEDKWRTLDKNFNPTSKKA